MSQLSAIKDEILRRFQRPRQPMDERMPDGQSVDEAVQSGTNGGERFSPPQAGQTPSIFAPPQNSPASVFTPPRNNDRPVAGDAPTPTRVNPMLPPPMATPDTIDLSAAPVTQQSALSQVSTPPPQMSWNPLTMNPKTGQPEISPTAKGNPLDIATRERDALQAWKPQGHRSVKTALKEGAIGAANAVNANPNNPYAAIGGFGAGAISGGIQPGVVTRNFELNKSNQDVNRMLTEQHARNTVDNAGLIPVQLNDGRMVMIPRAKAADMESKQQTIQQGERRINASESLAKAHAARWDAMDRHQAATEAQAIYNSGAADNDPDLLAEVGKRMGLSKSPPPHTQGEIRLDKNGNYILINKRGGAVTETGEESYVPQQEQNKTERAKLQVTAADARQQAQILATNSRDALNRGDRQNARQLDRQAKAATIYGQYLGGVEMSRDPDPTTSAKGKAIMKAQRGALQGYGDLYGADKDGNITQKEVAATQASPQAQSKGTWNPKRFAAAFQVKHGRPPTQAETDVYAKAAQQ